MIRLRHTRSREALREHLPAVTEGVKRLLECLAIEAEETVGWGAVGRSIVRRRLAPRIADLLSWIQKLAEEPEA